MKKLIIAAAIVCAAAFAQAASFSWSGVNIWNYAGTSKFNGNATVICSALGLSFSGTVANGILSGTGSSDDFVVDQEYSFIFKITDGEATYTSGSASATAQKSSTSPVGFGSQMATKTKSNWVVAPEPTSGLLLLLGMAGLALKRKRA